MISFLTAVLFASSAQAFILINPNYKLSKPEDTRVNIVAGGCRSIGITDAVLEGAIAESLSRYWNTVAESRLNMKVGGEVPRSTAAESGEVLVGCGALPETTLGVTYPDSVRGSAVIILNSMHYNGTDFNPDSLIGTLSHELGHAVGLSHSGDPASIMTYESHEWGPAAKFLSQDDKDGVVYLYGNEPQLGGLMGGCQAIAAGQTKPKFSLPWVLFDLFMLLGSGHALAFVHRHRFSRRQKSH